MKHELVIQGTATLQILGMKDGKELTMTFPRANEHTIQFRVKYFQEIDSKLELPVGFHARTIKVQVVGQGGTQTVERTFEWPRT